ncbi:MAG TPA: hypothetical protein VFV69_02235 [Steroidobacteraceae bacterium]|nr:hypothetical protein [Steroidobacteraceae bacterium]
MPSRFNGTIDLDIRKSKADWPAFLDATAPLPHAVRPLRTLRRGLCIGYDSGVSSEYKTPATFSGDKVIKAVFDVADDHYIDVERRMAAALARD